MSMEPVDTVSAGELTFMDIGKTVALDFKGNRRAVAKLVSLEAGWFDANGDLSSEAAINELPDLPQYEKLRKLRIGLTVSFNEPHGIVFLCDPEDRIEMLPSAPEL